MPAIRTYGNILVTPVSVGNHERRDWITQRLAVKVANNTHYGASCFVLLRFPDDLPDSLFDRPAQVLNERLIDDDLVFRPLAVSPVVLASQKLEFIRRHEVVVCPLQMRSELTAVLSHESAHTPFFTHRCIIDRHGGNVRMIQKNTLYISVAVDKQLGPV